MKGIKLEEKTWVEAEDLLQKSPFILIPLGARLKEHGPHLPLNTDWLIAEKLTEHVLSLFPVLALPTIQHNYYPAFINYPGSINIQDHTAKEYVLNIILSLNPYCRKKFYILNTGVSTCWVLEPLKWQLHEKGIIMEYFDWKDLEGLEDVLEQPEGTHADEFETSLMMEIAPQVVKTEHLIRDIHPQKQPGPFTRNQSDPRGRYSPSGVYGDATMASKHKGHLILQAIKTHLTNELQEFLQPNYELKPAKNHYL